MIHILEDKSSNIRVGLGVDVLVSMSVFQFASVESHFSLISFSVFWPLSLYYIVPFVLVLWWLSFINSTHFLFFR